VENKTRKTRLTGPKIQNGRGRFPRRVINQAYADCITFRARDCNIIDNSARLPICVRATRVIPGLKKVHHDNGFYTQCPKNVRSIFSNLQHGGDMNDERITAAGASYNMASRFGVPSTPPPPHTHTQNKNVKFVNKRTPRGILE